MYGKFVSELGDLANTAAFTEPLNIEGCDKAVLLSQLEGMLQIRFAEEAIGDLALSGEARCPCHLGIGQEAVAVGVSSHLTATDRVFSGHRSHPHFLALGGELSGLMHEVLGKAEGSSKGMGGSQHLYAEDKGFIGSVPIVGGTIPIAVGAALAAHMDQKGDVAITYFGDGASEEGVLHESLNLASNFSLPVLFVCENNLYSSHLDIRLRQPSDRISRFAESHHVATRVVDGNDVTAVSNAAKDLLRDCRAGKGPGFLEAVTYRWRGHVGPHENIDVGLRRSEQDLLAWKKRDPIDRLKKAMIQKEILTVVQYDDLVKEMRECVSDAVATAQKADYPPNSALLDIVYSEK